jgi:hypothetical protein
MNINEFFNFESRKEKRTQLLFEPLLLDADGRVVARVADLSMGGAMLFTRRGSYAVGDRFSGWLQAPPMGDDTEETFLAISMEVRWAEELNEGKWLRLGCKFTNPPDAGTASKLRRLIALAEF